MSTTQNETVRPIEDTIREALQDSGYGSYISYAGPVIEALKARETALADQLVDYAVDAGADVTEVQAYLKEIGMSYKPVEDDEDDEDDESSLASRIEAKLDEITRQVGSLTQFARSNGYRG